MNNFGLNGDIALSGSPPLFCADFLRDFTTEIATTRVTKTVYSTTEFKESLRHLLDST